MHALEPNSCTFKLETVVQGLANHFISLLSIILTDLQFRVGIILKAQDNS